MDRAEPSPPSRMQVSLVAVALALITGMVVALGIGLGLALTTSNANNALLREQRALSTKCIKSASDAAANAKLASDKAAEAAELARLRAK